MTESDDGSAVTGRLRAVLDRLWTDVEQRARAAQGFTAGELFLAMPDGPIQVAVDSAHERHLLIPTAPTGSTRGVETFGAVALSLRDLVLAGTPARYIDLHCRRPDLAGVFLALSADVCERVAGLQVGTDTVGRIVGDWRQLLSGTADGWTVPRVAGLFGELRILSRALDLDPTAVELWNGAYGEAHDFHSAHDALEVKTTTSLTGRLIHVHGLDQLEVPAKGRLDVVWARLTETGTGATTQSLVTSCLGRAADPALLLRALEKLHVPAGDHPLMQLSFEVVEERWYRVDTAFPRVVTESFRADAVPGGVSGIEYVVDLDVVGAWRTDDTERLAAMVKDR